MEFIGLLLVAFALFWNLKAYPNVFIGKKKRVEQEKKFQEAFEKIDEAGLDKHITNRVFGMSLILTILFNFLFYLITSSIVANPIMYALAVIIFLLNTITVRTGVKAMSERKFNVSSTVKLVLPLKTLYIIGFFILFFL